MRMDETSLLLVTGATGYIGGQLLRVLQAEGRRVRCLVRNPDALSVPPAPATEICAVDVLDGSQLSRAFAGVHTAYYFVHSMSSVGDFASEDRRCARNFGRAAREAGVRRIIYLGGLGDDAGGLSPHLRSRHEVGDVLRESGVPVVEFRASVVIGAGSLSFELIRSLVLRLPVMIVPRWMENPTQPIGTEDVIAYFLAALDLPEGENRLFEIGGPDVVTYGDLVREYARRRGVKRLMIPVPFFSPRLSGLWLRLVAPHYARVGEKLIESLRNPTVVRDPAALGRRGREFFLRAVDRLFPPPAGLEALGRSRIRVAHPGPPERVRGGAAGGGVSSPPAHRREQRLVFRRRPLEVPGIIGSADRGARYEGAGARR